MPAKTNEETLARARALLRSGLSSRAAARKLALEGHTVSDATLRRMAQKERVEAAPADREAPPARRSPPPSPASVAKRPQSPAPGAPIPAPSAVKDTGDAPDADFDPEQATADADEAIGAAVRRLDRAHRLLVGRVDVEAAHPQPDFKLLQGALRASGEIEVRLERLRPMPKLDPDADPENLAARDAVLDKLDRLLAVARQRGGAASPVAA